MRAGTRLGRVGGLGAGFVVAMAAPAFSGHLVPDLKIRRSAAVDYVGTGTGEDCLYAPKAEFHVKVGETARFDVKAIRWSSAWPASRATRTRSSPTCSSSDPRA